MIVAQSYLHLKNQTISWQQVPWTCVRSSAVKSANFAIFLFLSVNYSLRSLPLISKYYIIFLFMFSIAIQSLSYFFFEAETVKEFLFNACRQTIV